ncbi:ficolin-1-like [Anopheles nili]|uniref:ficolin-1-like n=1 Tax=Anopheles nili TaxID=185578 RepID=UPI00237AC6F9|nr:ficolin-1-like [Anopheles nili]
MWFATTLLLLGLARGGLSTHCDFPQSLCFDSEPALTNLDLLKAAVNNLASVPATYLKPADLIALVNQITNKIKESGAFGSNTYKTCADVPSGSPSGLYLLRGEFRDGQYAYCDMEYDGGGWQVFQRRFNGKTDFLLMWSAYQNGFGDMKSGEFWWGLNNLYRATNLAPHELAIVMEDFDGVTKFAKYSAFQIGDETELYRMNVLGTYSGTAGDSLRVHLNMAFTTTDRDNDLYPVNCAVQFTGAWWYSRCHDSNLNGQYLNGSTLQYGKGMTWELFRGDAYSLKSSRMMIRRLG